MKKIQISLCCIFLSLFAVAAQDIVEDRTGFTAASSDNVAEMLKGKVAGVRVSDIDGNPLGFQNVHIRGINSLRSDNQPLWIVDGVMLSQRLGDNRDAFWQFGEQSYTAPLNPLSFLSASEIESIEVLKDASATALYGTRGANGVIIVRTKRHDSRQRDVRYGSNVSINTPVGIKSGIGVSHDHLVGISGSDNKAYYNISGTFRSIDGVLPRNKGNYGSVRGNFETTANEYVWFGLNANLSAGAASSPTGTAWLGYPSYTLALRDPELSQGISAQDWLSDYDDDTEDYRGVLSTYLRVNFSKSLSLKLDAGLDLQDNRRVIWYGKKTDLGRVSEDNPNGGAGSILSSLLLGYNANLELRFNRYFGSEASHYFSAALGGALTGSSDKLNTINARNFVTDELRGKGINIGNSQKFNHCYHLNHTTVGAYLALNYDWKKIAGINLAVRGDMTPKYQWKVMNIYPAADAYVDIHRIVMPDFKPVSSIRIDGGYGWSGYEKFVPYDLFGNYLTGQWLEPETGKEGSYDGLVRLLTKEWHVGVDLGFAGDRLSLSADYYDRLTDDMFNMLGNGRNEVPVSLAYDRIGRVSNKGLEIGLGAHIIDTDLVNWTLNANLAYNANVVTAADMSDFYGKVVGNDVYCSCNAKGLPVSALYGYLTDADGNYQDATGEGLVTTVDRVVLGSSLPKVYGGLQTELKVWDFVLALHLDGAAGHHIANINSLVRDGFADSDGKAALSLKYVEKGDFLRIGQLGLKYNIPLKVKWIKAMSVRFSAHNLMTFTKYSGWNPDVNSFGINALSSGFDYGSYPAMRSYIFGININF